MQRFRAPVQCVVALALFAFYLTNADAVSFAGTGIGPIPDGTATRACSIATAGTPLVVSFAVSGITTPLSTVGVRMTFSPHHTYVQDLHVNLAAPGGSPSLTIFGKTGSGIGGSPDATGPYVFSDSQTGDWWATAAVTAPFLAIPSGGYRTTVEAAATQTSLNATFGALPPAKANGVWTLSFTDDCAGDTGSISEATLFIDDVAMPVRLETYSVD